MIWCDIMCLLNFSVIKRMDNFNQVKTMNLKKYIGTIIKNVEMDDLDGYCQDGAGSRFDVKIGKLVGEEIVDVEYDSAGRE